MNKLLSCEFNIDTGNVELRYADGSMISIDCTEVEKEVAMSINARSELDWLIYNAPLHSQERIDLIFRSYQNVSNTRVAK